MKTVFPADSAATGSGVGVLDFNVAARQLPTMEPVPRFPGHDVLASFKQAMQEAGLCPDNIIDTSGKTSPERCPTADDRPGRKSGWYVFYGDTFPAGAFGNWKTGESWNWSPKKDVEMSPVEQAMFRQKIERARIAREEARKALAIAAAKRARDNWERAIACTSHPYLSRKSIASFGLRLLAGKLLVPVTSVDGTLRSIQEIDAEGNKKFYFGGEKQGCCFCIPGTGRVAVCEGYATAATVHMATGWTVLVAFDAGNLLPVAENWRKAHPGDVMVICGDDDRWNDENTGRAHAENCGLKVYAQVVFPTFEDTTGHPTDWNDLLVAEGLETVRRQLLQSEKANRIRLEDWSLAAYAGEPRERKWIVENVIPAGVAFVLAAMGDAGKGMLMLDLALKVAGKVPLQRKTDSYDFNPELTAFGNPIRTQGKVVMLLAEDDRDEVQRRLHGIGLGKAQNLFIIPLPNTGGPMPIIVPGRNGPELTSAWLALRQQIVECKPTLVVLDPLSSFVMADINSDPAVGAFTMGQLATLAQETGAAVVVTHHLAKNGGTNITTPEQARAMIRGTSAIVDNSRAAYVLWAVDPKESKSICRTLQVEWQRNRVMRGCVVKSNAPADREIKIFVRNNVGLLEVCNERLEMLESGDRPQLMDLLVQVVADAAERGQPFKRTGSAGFFARRNELPEALQQLGRTRLEKMGQDLLDAGRIVQCVAKGSTSKSWLDVPGGVFALGAGEVVRGAMEVV